MPRALLVLCSAAVCAASVAVPATASEPPYTPPVDAAVLDPFRPPETRYGPGNRGVDYATAAGTPVRAVADGTVTFAGSVGGTRHVTVLHADGVRTTYSFLDDIDVAVGQRVHQGQRVGTTVGPLHLGARRGDAYFDPLSLFDAGPPQVHLVPFDDPPGSGAGGERSAISQLIGGLGTVIGGGVDGAGALGRWLRDEGGALVASMEHYASRFTYPASMVDASLTAWRAWQRARRASERPCTAPTEPIPPSSNRRVAVLVAGVGSNSEGSTIDEVRTAELGYARADVVRFSYAGGRVPDPTDGFPSLPTTRYDASATQADLHGTAARLADLVEAMVGEVPTVSIDLFAHSQGGLVVRLALIELERRHGAEWLARIGLVATLGTPHGGADLATAIHALSSTRSGATVLDVVAAATGQELDHDGASVAQLSETSSLVEELAAHPVPDGIDAISIAARGDVIVPAPRSVAPGMDEVIVPLVGAAAHTDLPGSDAATRELRLALAGLPPGVPVLHRGARGPAGGRGHQPRRGPRRGGGTRRRHAGGRADPLSAPLASSVGQATACPHTTPCTRVIPRSPFGAPGPAPALAGTANHGKGAHRGRRHHEAAARGWCPLRTPDPPLEPQDEAVHLR